MVDKRLESGKSLQGDSLWSIRNWKRQAFTRRQPVVDKQLDKDKS